MSTTLCTPPVNRKPYRLTTSGDERADIIAVLTRQEK